MSLKLKNAYGEVIKLVEKSKPRKIWADHQEYEKPAPLRMNGSQKICDIHIMAEYDKKTDIYTIELELKRSTLSERIGKWIFLSIHARSNKGAFYLVTQPKFKESFIEILKSKKIDAEVISVE